MRPRSFFLLGTALAAVVLIVMATAPSGGCSLGSSPGDDWVWTVVDIVGPLSILAIFAGIFTWSREQQATREWDHLTSFTQALIGAVIWGAAGFFVVFLIAVDKSGCLS